MKSNSQAGTPPESIAVVLGRVEKRLFAHQSQIRPSTLRMCEHGVDADQCIICLESRIAATHKEACIPFRQSAATLSDFQAFSQEQEKTLKLITKYLAEFTTAKTIGRSLILSGPTGTGKTMLACAMANHLILHGHRVRYTKSRRMLDDIKGAFDKNSDYSVKNATDKYVAYDLLIIDEVGREAGSDADKRFMFDVIDDRYDAMKPTILISNLPDKLIEGVLGDALYNRFFEAAGGVISFNWASFRGSNIKPLIPRYEFRPSKTGGRIA